MKQRFFGLDLMRAIAIIMVVVGHCSWIFPNHSFLTPLLALSAYFGVEIFFVLSGFLIGGILYKLFVNEDFNFQSVKTFLHRRWFRTLPNYFLILLLNIGIANLIGYEVEGLWRYFVFLQNFSHPLLPFFAESWSLSVEEFAYIFLPVALLGGLYVLKKLPPKVTFLLITILLIVLSTVARFFYHYQTAGVTIEQWNIGVKSVVIYRLDSIFIGVLCSWIYNNYSFFWIKIRKIAAVAGLLLLLFFSFGVGEFGLFIQNYPAFWNVIYLPLTSVTFGLFLPFLSEWKSTTKSLTTPIMFISLISYSMYLVHYGIVLQLMKWSFPTDLLSGLQLLIFTLIYLLITTFLSALLYRFYEKPMTDLREK